MIEVLCFFESSLWVSIEYPNTASMAELGGRFVSYERFVECLRRGEKVCMCYDIEPHEVFYMVECDF